MPSCTRRQTSAPLPAAAGPPAAVSVEPPARKARGKRPSKSADADVVLPPADTLSRSDTDGEITGSAKSRRLSQRRVMARRPRRTAAPLELAAAPSGAIAAADSDELDEVLVGEVMGAAAAGKVAAAGATREREQQLWAQGYARVAGVDEAGRGPLAGPVVAAAVVMPPHVDIPGVGDSKALTAVRREALYEQLMAHPDVDCATSVVSAQTVDEVNILQAALAAMSDAVAALHGGTDYVIIDGNRVPPALVGTAAEAIVKGDAKCTAIAAASIVAKVVRDRLMDAADRTWPQYGFAAHKGYGTPAHVAALKLHGPCVLHRRSFAPLRTWLAAKDHGVISGDDSSGVASR